MTNNEIIPGFDDWGGAEGLEMRLQKLDDKSLVLYFSGYMDIYNSNASKKKIDAIVAKGFVKLIADCRQLNYISSTGVGVLLEGMKKTKLLNGDFVLIHLQPKVAEVLSLLGFSKFFTMGDDLDEALQTFRGKVVKDWPLIFKCPICNRLLKASRSGRFRCSECKTVLAINPEFQVFLG